VDRVADPHARSERGHFVGYSHWLHPARAWKKDVESWTQIESVVEFMRFENVDTDPQVKDLKVTYSGWGDRALRVPHFIYPELSIAQEPSIVRLPDQRLFSVMRTNSGFIWYSVSADDGRTWTNTRPLLRRDFGQPILEPVAAARSTSLPMGAMSCCITTTAETSPPSRRPLPCHGGQASSRWASSVTQPTSRSGSASPSNSWTTRASGRMESR